MPDEILWGIGGLVLGGLGGIGSMYVMLGPLFMTFLKAYIFKNKWILLEDNPNGILVDKIATYDSSGKFNTPTQSFTATPQVFRLRNGMKVALVANDSVLAQSPTFARVLDLLKTMGITREMINANTGLRAITDYLDELADPEKEKIITERAVIIALKRKDDIIQQVYALLPIGILFVFIAIAYQIIMSNPQMAASVAGAGKGILPM